MPALAQNSGGKAASAGEAPQVAARGGDTFDVTVRDTDLSQVLEMLAIQAKRNIIASKSVSGTVNANLYDVTFSEAMDAILKVNNYTWYEEGNFIYVITKDEANAMEAAKKKTESRLFQLNYLGAEDANELITPMLSEKGKSAFRGNVEPGIKPEISNVGADSFAYAAQLVVTDYPENLDAIASKLKDLDTPPKQVLVEATIIQTNLDDASAFGVDFSVLADINFTDLTAPLLPVTNLLNGNDADTGFQPSNNHAGAAQTSVGRTNQAGGLKVGILTDDISVFVNVLDEVTDSNVLARPKIMALNRQRAQVLVGTRVGYLSTTATETTTTQTVEFLDTGIELVFRPFISNDGMIRLELSPSVSDARLRTVTDSNGLGVTIPDELTNELTTNVRIKDGQTLVLGGLFKESTTTSRRQVPLLGDIPILGAAFRGQDDSVGRSEIMFLITPTIVQDETLWEEGADALTYVDSVRVGARAGLLPFSRDKISQGYNREASDAFAAGDTETALYNINRSLNLQPSQPEMIRFRSIITGEKEKSHERSMLERVFRRSMTPTKVSQATESDDTQMAQSDATDSTDDSLYMSATSDEQKTAVANPDQAVTVDDFHGWSEDFAPGMDTDDSTTTDSSSTTSGSDSSSSTSGKSASAAGSSNSSDMSEYGATQSVDMTVHSQSYYDYLMHNFFAAVSVKNPTPLGFPTDRTAQQNQDMEFPFTTFDQTLGSADSSDEN
ncbi:MAG TPA: hypothetical protein VG711_11790 [Phycisphaerales bacterium]|nr:hypothetical protein [Phycisphaerales bacterium]